MKTYTFVGKLVTESETIEDIKGEIECLPSGEIVFLTQGDNVELFTKLYKIGKCKIEGTTSDKLMNVIIEDADRSYFGKKMPVAHYAAKFDVRSLRLVTPCDIGDDRKEWEINFFLSDLQIGRVRVGVGKNFDGSREITRERVTKVKLYGDIFASFDKCYSWEDAELHGEKGDFVYSSEVARVTVPKSAHDNIEEALKGAIQHLDNLFLIVSFAQRRWVHWYRYSVFTGTEIIDYFRSYKRTPNLQGKEYPLWEFVINPGEEEEFFSNSITEYAKLLSEEIDLRLPLIYLIGGHDGATTDARFLSYCVSLETLLAIFGKKSIISRENMPTGKFRLLKCKLEKIVKEEIDKGTLGSDECEDILSKMSSLNYQSLSSLTKQFFNFYKVQHEDLMDIKQILKFRNALLHGRGIENTSEFLMATYHLQWLLERGFLRVLNWTKSSNVDPRSSIIRSSIFKQV